MDDILKQALALGRGYYLKKEYALAEQYLTEVVEQNQSFADVYNMLGVIYHDQGQYQKAQRAFEAALRINPGYTDAALNLAVTYNDTGRYKDAQETYRHALSRSGAKQGKLDRFVAGKLANMYSDIGDVYLSSGMFQEAIVEYRRARRHAHRDRLAGPGGPRRGHRGRGRAARRGRRRAGDAARPPPAGAPGPALGHRRGALTPGPRPPRPARRTRPSAAAAASSRCAGARGRAAARR